MIETSQARSLLCRKELARVRAVAIRRGAWYKILSRTERALFSLTIDIIKRIRSNVLGRVLVSIIAKLEIEDKSGLASSSRNLGRSLAQKISIIAQAWGNTSAVKWSRDRAFIRFLEVIYLNTPATYAMNNTLFLKRG